MRFTDTYNHAIQETIGVSRDEMQNNRNLKIEYIKETRAKQNEIENSPDCKLNINAYVRLFENKYQPSTENKV
ncbi:MAG: hypothetical protein Ta2E_00430 [Mycoplasmoidaceae bacterium]|nr:MAG: hypothetical protein Ta2E_00430 [Mycoplasmoidaceae bacterium]